MTTIAQRSVRLQGKTTLELNRQSASSGEIFYDTDAQTLRIWANATSSTILATRTWVTANSPQSDWNQATTTAADFIKNKPTIPTNTNQLTNGAGFITTTGIPAQTGNSGKYLTTNGTAVSWGTITATASSVGLGNVTNESKATMFTSPTFTGTVNLSSNTASTSTSTGALIVAGGIGVAGAASIGGNVGIGVAPTGYGAKLAVDTSGGPVIFGVFNNTATSTGIFFRTTGIATVEAIAASTIRLKDNTGLVYLDANATKVDIPTATTSTSKTTGALTVTGGVGIGENLNVGGTLAISGSSSGKITFSAGTTPATQAYTLPSAYPAANGYALVSTTGGTLSWAAAGGGGGTTTNALTIGTGLTGTSFNGSAAVTVALATTGVPSQTVGSSTAIPVITVDIYGRITSVSTATPSGGSSSNSFASIYANAQGTPSAPLGGSPSILMNASSSSDTLYLFAGTNITITGTSSPNKTITISSTGGSSGITWSTNTSPSGSITVTNPTGYATSGSTMVIVVVGLSVNSSSASSGSGSFSTAASVGQNTRVFYTYTTSSLGTTTTISNITGYAMAYAYIGSGPSIATTSTSASSTSTTVMNPSPVYGTPRIIAVSQSSSLNLATLAGPATGGGPTWATGSGFVHPNDSNTSAAVWVGTGSWTTMATPTITSNPSFMSWYITGISIG